jgi:hypothetical protein
MHWTQWIAGAPVLTLTSTSRADGTEHERAARQIMAIRDRLHNGHAVQELPPRLRQASALLKSGSDALRAAGQTPGTETELGRLSDAGQELHLAWSNLDEAGSNTLAARLGDVYGQFLTRYGTPSARDMARTWFRTASGSWKLAESTARESGRAARTRTARLRYRGRSMIYRANAARSERLARGALATH